MANLNRFYDWVISKRKDGDQVGDIAKDIYDDKSFPKNVKTWNEIYAYLKIRNACEPAIKCARRAYFEFRGYI